VGGRRSCLLESGGKGGGGVVFPRQKEKNIYTHRAPKLKEFGNSSQKQKKIG